MRHREIKPHEYMELVSLPGEKWAKIPGLGVLDGFYKISTYGRVLRLAHQRPDTGTNLPKKIMKTSELAQFIIKVEGEQLALSVPELVLRAFRGRPPKNRTFACHHDGKMLNNWIENLFWGDRSQIVAKQYERGRERKSGNLKLTKSAIRRLAGLRAEDPRKWTYAKLGERAGVKGATIYARFKSAGYFETILKDTKKNKRKC